MFHSIPIWARPGDEHLLLFSELGFEDEIHNNAPSIINKKIKDVTMSHPASWSSVVKNIHACTRQDLSLPKSETVYCYPWHVFVCLKYLHFFFPELKLTSISHQEGPINFPSWQFVFFWVSTLLWTISSPSFWKQCVMSTVWDKNGKNIII